MRLFQKRVWLGEFEGYEIHYGKIITGNVKPLLSLDNETEGSISENRRVIGIEAQRESFTADGNLFICRQKFTGAGFLNKGHYGCIGGFNWHILVKSKLSIVFLQQAAILK